MGLRRCIQKENNMSNALEIKGLQKTYGDFRLRDVSIALPEGKIMGFVGQNGAGKTTTIRLILNMARKEGGEIKVFGLDGLKDEVAIKQDLAAVFDEVFFVETWNARDVESAIKGFYRHWDSIAYREYLNAFELPAKKKVKDMSRGMKLKLMLAVAMSHKARLLILDEPTSGLDPVAREELLGILEDYVSDGEKSVFFSTHITSDLERIAGFITIIDHGHIFYTGTKDDLMTHFLLVKGRREDLNEGLEARLLGLSRTSEGFTALIRAAGAEGLPEGIEASHPSIDEILVSISKGGISYE